MCKSEKAKIVLFVGTRWQYKDGWILISLASS